MTKYTDGPGLGQGQMPSLVPGIESAPLSTRTESQGEEGDLCAEQRMLGRQSEASALVLPLVPPEGCAGQKPPEHIREHFLPRTVFLFLFFLFLPFSYLHWLESPTQ